MSEKKLLPPETPVPVLTQEKKLVVDVTKKRIFKVSTFHH